MTRTEERVADALGAVADGVHEDTLRPLVAPASRRRRPSWLAPAAAAASVVLLAGLITAVVTLAGPAGGGPGGTAAPATLRDGVPRYYAEADLDGRITVRSTTTGHLTATLPLRAPAGTVGVVASAGSGVFFAAGIPPQGQFERLYRFQVTADGTFTGLTPVRGGLFGPGNIVDAMAVAPGGDRVAVSLTGPAWLSPGIADHLTVIDTATGQRTGWINSERGHAVIFQIASLSWTGDGQRLAVLGVWCRDGRGGLAGSRIICPGPQAGRTAAVLLLRPVRGHTGMMRDGQVLLPQSARYPYLAQAVISPDGRTLTVMVLSGRTIGQVTPSRTGPRAGRPRLVPGNLTVEQVAVPSGRRLGVLYRRSLGPAFQPSLAPDFVSLAGDSSGRHWIVIAGAFDPFNGWLDRGRLVPMLHVDRLTNPGFEAW